MAGFVLALSGIWLLSRPSGEVSLPDLAGLRNGLVAGLGFGGFFVLIAQVDSGGVFSSLVVAKMAALGLAMVALALRKNRPPIRGGEGLAFLAGAFDTGGNVFYLLASQLTRLDVAAVLSSLYPMMTVLLSVTFTEEVVVGRQWLGLILCLGSVGLIVAG
jgi:drug/metabolite transporter (DMT)-like permease